MSNKTPTKLDVETESAPRKRTNRLLLAFVFIACVIGGLLFFNWFDIQGNRNLMAPKGTIKLEWLDSSQERILGLSGRESIAKDVGLLFVFERSSTQNCFWMKDMKFSIDMVWLDEAKQVVTVSPDVSPDTYPDSFCPDSSAKYGLEIGAGQAEVLGIERGVRLSF